MRSGKLKRPPLPGVVGIANQYRSWQSVLAYPHATAKHRGPRGLAHRRTSHNAARSEWSQQRILDMGILLRVLGDWLRSPARRAFLCLVVRAYMEYSAVYSRLQGMLQGEQGSISTRTNPSCRRAWALPCPAAANRSRQIGITDVSSVIKWRLDDDLDDGTVPVFACQKAAGCGFLELPYRRWRDRLFCTC